VPPLAFEGIFYIFGGRNIKIEDKISKKKKNTASNGPLLCFNITGLWGGGVIA
jgi:hypothetical protein